MAESERLNTALEPGVKAMLVELAGGERKVGAYLSQLIRDVHAQQIVRGDVVRAQGEEIRKLVERMDETRALAASLEDAAERLESTQEWIFTHLSDALSAYEAMSDEERKSVTLSALFPPLPEWQYRRELLAKHLTPGEQDAAESKETPSDVQ